MSREGYYGSKCIRCAHLDGPTRKTQEARTNAEMWVAGARRRLDAWVARIAPTPGGEEQ